MNPQAVKEYFIAYPNLEKCFETYDGVLHPNEQEAKRWIERNAKKEIKIHDNPAFNKPKEEVVLSTEGEKSDKIKTLEKEIGDLKAEIDLYENDEQIDLENAENKLHVANLKAFVVTKQVQLDALQTAE